MATTTPNFGWTVPTSSDLVKNGATAIETLGDAIDASLVDLKGGTTGQVLAKASGTDMDFSWVSDAAGMTNPMTTTGDTIYSSSGSTPARLGIGTTGQVLTVASGVPSWATPAASASGLTFISKTAFTTSTTININSVFSSTYDNYRIIVFWNTPSAPVGDLTFKLRASGADTSANYNQQRFYANQAATGASRNPFGTDEWFVAQGATSGIGTMSMDLFRPNLAATTGYTAQTGNFASNDSGMELTTGTQTDTTQFDGFSLLYSQSNTGTAYIYGYQKA